MRHPFLYGALVTLFFAACESARTQNEPQVITTPAVEASPSPTATPVPSPTPAEAATPAPSASPATAAAASRPPRLSYNSCYVDGPYIAMTFDDGPSKELTPKLLDMLKARNIHATFFVVGQNAADHPEILKRMIAEGHEIGNHSWSHPALNKLGGESLKAQLEKTNDAVVAATGIRPTIMRPPYGATSPSLDRLFNEQYHMKVILWSVDPLDWKYRNANRVHDQILAQTGKGGIVLAHDIHATTVAAMPQTLDDLAAKGYEFVTVSELLAMDKPAPPKPSPTPKPSATPGATPKPKKPHKKTS